ncbi:Protein of unknown function [Bacillus wiedmannii]|nr:Protein of unknown function [Bacillus wiedmannii]
MRVDEENNQHFIQYAS